MNKLRIQVIKKPKRSFNFPGTDRIYNFKPFEYGLRIKNLDSHIFNGGIISKVRFALTGPARTITNETAKEQILIKKLNPQESTDTWIDIGHVNLSGEYWLDCQISADDGQEVQTFQFDPLSGTDGNKQINSWGGPFFVDDLLLKSQLETNRYLLILTALMFIATAISVYCSIKAH